MTRINVGIDPKELCDQHLIAETAKELPPQLGRVPRGRVPDRFTLDTGHANWCALRQVSLNLRYWALMDECAYRGFSVADHSVDLANCCMWSSRDERIARPLLIDRINLRLAKMWSYGEERYRPRWTKRETPDWAVTGPAAGAIA